MSFDSNHDQKITRLKSALIHLGKKVGYEVTSTDFENYLDVARTIGFEAVIRAVTAFEETWNTEGCLPSIKALRDEIRRDSGVKAVIDEIRADSEFIYYSRSRDAFEVGRTPKPVKGSP